MALKCWDGFDHYKQTADICARSGFLQHQQAGSNPATLSIATGRLGGEAMSIFTSLNPQYIVFGQRVASAFVGFGCLLGPGAGAGFQFDDTVANATQVWVHFDAANYAIEVYRGGSIQSGGYTLIGSSANNVWSGNSWNFVEIWADINSSSGFVKVYVNGVLLLTVTGNTQATANATWDRMGITSITPGGGLSGTTTMDDLYYADTTTGGGSFPCNAPIGDVRVVTMFPSSNNSVQWTPLSGSNFSEVNELAMDSDTTYNSDANVGDQDLFNMGTLPSTGYTVLGVAITYASRKDDAGSRSVESTLKSGATTVNGTSNALGTTYAYFSDIWVLDPNTGSSWTALAVNVLNAGYKVSA